MSNDLSDNYKLALEVSIKFCGYRERSVKEVENKLIDKRFSRDVIRLTLKKIKGLGFVDNLRFSKSFSRGKNNNNRWGKNKIRYELIAKGLNDNEIQEGIRSIDERTYKTTLNKNIELFKKKNKKFDKNKLINHLINKGFEIELILGSI
tara:strand:+ start:972 stop:1418 length:447 start_codon:yes stop_codon:yes gene_type:complete